MRGSSAESVYETDPLLVPNAQAEIRIISLIDQARCHQKISSTPRSRWEEAPPYSSVEKHRQVWAESDADLEVGFVFSSIRLV